MGTLDPQQVVESQRQDWNRVAPGWEKWDQALGGNLAFVNYRLVADARLRPKQCVLDLGSGTGYPALLAAEAVGPEGRVTGLDLAEAMLERARRKAAALRLSNVTFQSADVSTLPFDDGSFHAVVSRFCLMFLPDVSKAAQQIARVLRPGGYCAAAVWSAPEKNPFISVPMEVIKQFIDVPPPDPEAPGIYRLAKPGLLADMLEASGLRVLNEEEYTADGLFRSAEEYVSSMLDIAAPIQNLLAKVSSPQRDQVLAGIRRRTEEFTTADGVSLPMAVRIVSARKSRS